VKNSFNKSAVFLAGAALYFISSQQRRDYNGQTYCVTPAQYGGEIHYVTPGLGKVRLL